MKHFAFKFILWHFLVSVALFRSSMSLKVSQKGFKFRVPTLLGVHLDVVEMLGGEAGGVGALQLAVGVLKLAVGTLQLAVGTFKLTVRTFKLAVGFQFAVGTLKFAVVNLAVIPARLAGKICLCKI